MSRKKIRGNGGPMPLASFALPPYVVRQKRGEGYAFYFQVPKRLRPDGWAPTYRLPLASEKRTGRADGTEYAAIEADGNALYARLLSERDGIPDRLRVNSLPWLIQSFERALASKPRGGRKGPIAKGTLRGYRYAAKQVTEWSRESGHPHIKLITRPAILKFLASMSANPSKRKFVASYIRTLMFHAMDIGVRADNPAIKLGVEAPDATVHVWEDRELDAMVRAAEGLGIKAVATAMLIAHDEGPRPGDILGFQWVRDYTLRDGAFRYYQAKTKEWVVSPAGQRVRARLAKGADAIGPIITNPRTGKRYNERIFIRDFDRVRTAADLPNLQFRHLRHTFVVKAKRAGLDPFEIASKTGHAHKSVEDMLRKHYLPHDSEVATNATIKIEAYRKRKSDASVGCQFDAFGHAIESK